MESCSIEWFLFDPDNPLVSANFLLETLLRSDRSHPLEAWSQDVLREQETSKGHTVQTPLTQDSSHPGGTPTVHVTKYYETEGWGREK